MSQASFLDTNVIINYANYQKDKSDEIVQKCYSYVISKPGKFIVCYAVIRELSNVITKRSIIHKEVLRKIENNTYSFADSKNLSKRDIPFAEKLYLSFSKMDKEKLKETLASERDIFEIEIERFLKNKVDLRVVPIDQIKFELTNLIREVIENYADCQILASALQYQTEQKSEIFLFVTTDKKDLNPNSYDYLKDYGSLKNYIFPELHNLLFVG
ncbi:MAG: PIN domain-containing protein [archaeon]